MGAVKLFLEVLGGVRTIADTVRQRSPEEYTPVQGVSNISGRKRKGGTERWRLILNKHLNLNVILILRSDSASA